MPAFTPTALPCRILSHLSLSSCLVPAFCVLPALFSCKDTVTDPEKQKDWRSITWEIDTITYPGSYQTAMRSIYATGPENVYIVGHNDQPGSPTMFRYDGGEWKTTGFHASEGGSVSGAVSLSAITGFGPGNIWVVGERIFNPPDPGSPFPDSSLILHFDGVTWAEQLIQGGSGRRLQCIWGSGPSDIWAAGMNTLLHYNGLTWQHFPVEIPQEGIFFLSIAGVTSTDIFMVGSRRNVDGVLDTIAYFMYHFDGFGWSIIDSLIWSEGPWPDRFGALVHDANGRMYSVEYGVFQRDGSRWVQIFDTEFPLTALRGLGNGNLIAGGTADQIWHYNGQDWFRYPQFAGGGTQYSGIWADKNNVMIVGTDGYRSFVLRGK